MSTETLHRHSSLRRQAQWSSYAPIEDATDDFDTLGNKMLGERIWEIMNDLTARIEEIGANPYWSTVAFTPQGNLHTAYANGAIKNQGEAAARWKVNGFSAEDQLEAFKRSADATFAAIIADKPEGRDRLIWREMPKPKRIIRDDGLYILIYTRIGWDKSEG